jgi:uncharacterized membrane protein
MNLPRCRPPRDERGSILPLTVLTLTVVLGFTAFATDLGLQRVAARDMQAIADIVALDTARTLPTCEESVLDAAATASLARQRPRIGRESDLVVTAGHLDHTTKKFAAGPLNGECDAVKIRTATTVDFAFAPVIGTDSGDAVREAVGTRSDPSLCFSVGTSLLALDTTSGTLAPVLDQILKVNLKAVGYEGIVTLKNVTVPISDLLVELNVGSPAQLATTTVSLDSFALAAAEVLRANGETASAEVLEALKIGVSSAYLTVGDILDLGTATTTAGLTTGVNVLDILTAAIVAANGQNAVAVSIPGLADLKLIEPPVIACGRIGAKAESAQARIRLTSPLNGTTALGLVGGSLDVGVNLGQGEAILTGLNCTAATPTASLTVKAAGAAVAAPTPPAFGQVGLTVTMDKFLSVLGPLGTVITLPLKLLGLNEVKLDVLLSGTVTGTTENRTATFPTGDGLAPDIVTPSSGNASVLQVGAAAVRLSAGQSGLAAILAPVLNAALGLVLTGLVAPVVNTVVDPLLSTLLTPVLRALGLKLGTAEVKMLGRPSCAAVRLAG